MAVVSTSCGGATLTTQGSSSGDSDGGTTTDVAYGPPVMVRRPQICGPMGCLPQRLLPDATGDVPCIVLVNLAPVPSNLAANEHRVCTAAGESLGLSPLPADLLDSFNRWAHDDWVHDGARATKPDPSHYATCELRQIPFRNDSSCATGADPGWCYVQGDGCAQGIAFGPSSPPPGSTAYLECMGP